MTPAFVLLLSLHPLISNANATPIPTHFEADRVFATPLTRDGKLLKLYTDTGGGGNLLCSDTAARLHLKLEPMPSNPELEAELGKNLSHAHLPEFLVGSAIPANADGNSDLLVSDCAARGQKFLTSMGEGLLSSRWFAGRVWTWNYPAHSLVLESSGWKPQASATRAAIGFRQASASGPAFSMPRITVRVAGEDLDLLLDTGATGYPTAAAQNAQGGDIVDGARATSFITTSMLEAWHRAHPDWVVVADGDDLFAPRIRARLIRVPQMQIAGWNVGPVWFTERADGNFHQMMSSMTDKRIEGALGGNALSHFAMTLDYPGAVAWFRCTSDCEPIPRSAP
ncbi:MAG: hypothetical protein ABIS07_06690 [Dokdonella sp.]